MTLLGETSFTPVCVRAIPCRFQKELGPPRNLVLSRIAEKPRAVPSVGFASPDDQKKFDHEYREWQEKRREGDRDGVAKHEGKMQELMARYNIPRDVPYDVLASAYRGY